MQLPKSVFLSTKLLAMEPNTRTFVLRFGITCSYPAVLYRYLDWATGNARSEAVCSLQFRPASPVERASALWVATSSSPFYPDQSPSLDDPAGAYQFFGMLRSPRDPAETVPSGWTPGSLELTVIEKCCPYS